MTVPSSLGQRVGSRGRRRVRLNGTGRPVHRGSQAGGFGSGVGHGVAARVLDAADEDAGWHAGAVEFALLGGFFEGHRGQGRGTAVDSGRRAAGHLMAAPSGRGLPDDQAPP